MSKHLLGIDIGTSSIKVALVDQELQVISQASQSYLVSHNRDGRVSISMETLWRSFVECLKSMAQEGAPLCMTAGIGISCMCPGLVAIGEDRCFLSEVILYSDRRSQAEAVWVSETAGEDYLFETTANNVMAGAISVTSILWIKNNYPEIYKKTKVFGHINTAMSIMLTGKAAIDPSNASYSGLFETAGRRTWSKELCQKLGVDCSKLPPLKQSDEICGYLDAKEVLALGVPLGTPVVIGGADTPCGTIGCGGIQDGYVCESIGTTDVLTVCIDKPVFDRAFLNRCHTVRDLWLYQGAMSNTGYSMNWCLQTLCGDLVEYAEQTGENPMALMDIEGQKAFPGANGVVFLPYLTGERSPIWDSKATGVFYGVTLDTKREDLIRAVMESSCYGIRQMLELCEKLTNRRYESINLFGGGAKSRIWAQMKADILNRTIRIMENRNAAVLGAAVLAGVGAGVFASVEDADARLSHSICCELQPNATPDEAAAYESNFRVFCELYQHIKPIFAKYR